MSTSSGRQGLCDFCGHALNEHASTKDSKCRRKGCNGQYLICQTSHKGVGWRICNITCGHGDKYMPDKAKAARHLEPEEYATSHPLYQPPQEDSGPSIAQTHQRNLSKDSEDPLQWESDRLDQELAAATGNLTIAEGKYVKIKARYTDGGSNVSWDDADGYTWNAPPDEWIEYEDGFYYDGGEGAQFYSEKIKQEKDKGKRRK